MWPFSSDDENDEGCTTHHWPDTHESTGETKTRGMTIKVYENDGKVDWTKRERNLRFANDFTLLGERPLTGVTERLEQTCLHEGCNETQGYWEDVGLLDIENGEFHEDVYDHFDVDEGEYDEVIQR